MRQGEILGLCWKNIDFDRGTIRIFGQLQAEPGRPRGETLVVNERPKWGSDRTIGVPTETSFVLEALRVHRQRQRVERIAAGAILLAAGVPERVVKEILGHSTLAMVKRYQHVLPGLTVAAAERMDRGMGR